MPSREEFDEEGYVLLHPDVAAAIGSGSVGSGWQHFVLHGFAEGRGWVSQVDRLQGVSREIAPDDEMLLGNPDHYFDVGDSALRCIEGMLMSARRPKGAIRRILDLPCGHGRVLRFLRKGFPHARLTACDINRPGVEFCAKTFDAEPVVSCADVAHIPLRGGFDLIWCGSLLTHLPLGQCEAFLALFQRVLAPDGIVVFTLHGRGREQALATGRTLDGLEPAQTAALLAGYHRTGFGYVDYTGRQGYGFSLAHPSFVTSRFLAPGFRLLGYQEDGWDKRQDVVAVQNQPMS